MVSFMNCRKPLANRCPVLIFVVSRYLGFLMFANLAWEFAHMPLYTLWYEGSRSEIVFSGLHCTLGDLMIASLSLFAGVLLTGRTGWPVNQKINVAIVTIMIGLSYTAFSEWLNVYVREAWRYSVSMPVLPGTGLGVSPLAQWFVLPVIGFALAYRGAPSATSTVFTKKN